MSRDTTEIYDVVPVFAVDETGKALITEEQYSWLCNYAVHKAERVQELENIIYQDARQDVLEGLYVQKERYKETLEFYADEENYKPFDGIFLSGYQNKVDEDSGEKARKALEGEE